MLKLLAGGMGGEGGGANLKLLREMRRERGQWYEWSSLLLNYWIDS